MLTAPAKVKVDETGATAASGLVKETDRHHRRQTNASMSGRSKNREARLPAESQLTRRNGSGAASVSYFIGDVSSLFRGTAPRRNAGSFLEKHPGRTGWRAATGRRGQQTRLAAVEAIRDYISKNIRVAGPAFHRSAVERVVRRRHDPGRRLRASGGSRHSFPRDAFRRRLQTGVCRWHPTCRPWLDIYQCGEEISPCPTVFSGTAGADRFGRQDCII